MSENTNFIPATELPEAEGDEVSVLCVENGELKQKAASGLGGNTNYDIVVRITRTYNSEEDEEYATGEIISGSFDEVVNKLDAGIEPTGLCIECGTIWGNREIKSVSHYTVAYMAVDGAEALTIPGWFGDCLLLRDGTVNLL